MAKQFSSGEAKTLIARHKELITGLTDAVKITQDYRNSVKEISDAIVNSEVMKVLREIPVDEINREKGGFRVKTLHENGYNTIADVAAAPVKKIAAINGIGDETAKEIKKVVNGIVRKTRPGTKIRLSVDTKTAATTKLVLAISKYIKSARVKKEAKKLLTAEREKIVSSAEAIAEVSGGLKRLFASKEKKQLAAEAYNYLSEKISGDYAEKAKFCIKKNKEAAITTPAQAWAEFEANPVLFINVLEKVNPGILGNDDTLYGLPEDLAAEIEEEKFNPDGLLCQLRRYQEWGVKYILHQGRVLLGDEMGLGKTVQAIATMVSLMNGGATHFVVVCPASVITNWCREIQKMSVLSVTKVHGADRDSALESWIKNGGVAVTTYETTAHFSLPDGFRISLVVVDEAHYIKNPEAARTKNVRRICASASRLLFMTGTALENKVEEMVSLIEVLQPVVARKVHSMMALAAAPQFRTAVAPVYYRRKRKDVLTELPELIESKEWCTISGEEEEAYEKAVLSENFALARRVSFNIDDMSKSSKAQRLLELVGEAEAEGRKIIVFSFFLDTIAKVSSLLGEKCLQPINGSVSPQRRQEIIDEFDKAPAGTVLAAQIQSGGTGLNIQSASVVILCEPQFKPSIENQAISRAYRMGQTRNVLVYRLLCDDTVDEKITDLLESKQAIFDAFADDSVAAKQPPEIDDTSFGTIIKEEIERINSKLEKSGVGI